MRASVAVLAVTCSFLAAGSARPLAAQAGAAAPGRPPSDSLPRELVALLMTHGPFEDQRQPEFVVGRLPIGVPADVVPAGATILGGLTHPQPRAFAGRRRGATVVLLLRDTTAGGAGAYEAHLERTGWRRPSEMRTHGGFVPESGMRPVMVCRDSAMLNAFVGRRAAGGSYVRLQFDVGGGGMRVGPCDASAGMHIEPPFDDFPEFPALHAPPGAVTIGAGGGGGPDARETSTRLETSLAPAAIAAHYATQLRSAGWALGSQIVSDGVAIQTASRTVAPRATSAEAPPQPWHAVLLVTALPGTRERDVALRIARPSSQR